MGNAGTDSSRGYSSYGGYSSYSAVEVVLMKRQQDSSRTVARVVLSVANDPDTIAFVKDNMDAIAGNVVRLKRMKAEQKMNVEESAQLFQKNLEPLFSIMSANSTEHVLDALSMSLKKALLLMAMDRYDCDSERVCRALGISRAKLETELKRCGLPFQESQAA